MSTKLTKDQRQENAIMRRVIHDALAAGYTVDVNDGDETTIKASRKPTAIFAAMKSTCEDYLILRDNGRRVGFVRFVYGNAGDEVICDHSDNVPTNTVLAGAHQLAEHYCGTV